MSTQIVSYGILLFNDSETEVLVGMRNHSYRFKDACEESRLYMLNTYLPNVYPEEYEILCKKKRGLRCPIKRLLLDENYIWEAPKGRPKMVRGGKFMETGQETAIRELREETGIKRKSYSFTDRPPLDFSYTADDNCVYRVVYYHAKVLENVDAIFKTHHSYELSKLKWASIEDLELLPQMAVVRHISSELKSRGG